MQIQKNYEKDSLLTKKSIATLSDNYLMPGEKPQDLFERVALAYADDQAHAQRLYDYMSSMWFMPATPILANGGLKNAGLPISCFLNEIYDNLSSVLNKRYENSYLSTSGGGIGTYVGNIREIGAKIGKRGQSLGIIPPTKVMDSCILADMQAGVRRGMTAVYCDINHPEIEEFIDIRRPTGGDTNRRCLNIHHAVCINDEFMQAVEKGAKWDLISRKTGETLEIVDARNLWIKILASRVETGEPYILFTGNALKNTSEVYRLSQEKYGEKGLKAKMSNLCSEIMLHTGLDYLEKERTAVCCLSSLNLEYFEEWEKNEFFIEDVYRMIDNVLNDFINKAPEQIKDAVYSAKMERSVGLGVMGFHSFLQSKNIPFEGVATKSWNKKIFKHIRSKADEVNEKLAKEKGCCPDASHFGVNARFSNVMAIAPTASISTIAGSTSPGIEPYAANSFSHKTKSGTFVEKNKYLQKLLSEKGYDNEKVWSSIAMNEGSVQHLNFLSAEEKEVFKTAMEINQMWLIEHAADRQQYIDQGQSLNIFLKGNIEKKALHDIHFQAWKKGVKSLYYCRSTSIQRAEKSPESFDLTNTVENKYEECLSCQ